jgi:purine-nucleoside phosphorylase
MLKDLRETVSWLRPRVPVETRLGLILGTGFGNSNSYFRVDDSIPYADIPHFPVSTVEGHSGNLLIGKLGGRCTLGMEGRFHYYEGYSMKEVTYPIRVMQLLGIKTLFITNAAGGINPKLEVGSMMMIQDHINMFPEHPLRGTNIPELGPRFPSMDDTYTYLLRLRFHALARSTKIRLYQGCYVGVQGPTFETPSEYGFFRKIGGDAVGMSTVPEAIVANHGGLQVLAVSAITDLGSPTHSTIVKHEDVMKVARNVQPRIMHLFDRLAKEF